MSPRPDVLMYNTIGPGFTGDSVRAEGIGGSELEITQIAESLSARGHRVVVANGVSESSEDHGVSYIPSRFAWDAMPRKALYIERMSEWPWAPPKTRRIAVRVTDLCSYPPPFAYWFSNHDAAAVCVSEWQAGHFTQAKERIVIPPILDPTPPTERVAGRFVFASAPGKGLKESLELWKRLHIEHSTLMAHTELVIAAPGYCDWPRSGWEPDLEGYPRVRYVGRPTPEDYRALIASAEGLFVVMTMVESFCCVAALAERSGTRPHILCCGRGVKLMYNGKDLYGTGVVGGILEALTTGWGRSFVTHDEKEFIHVFVQCLRKPVLNQRVYGSVEDRSRAALIPLWEKVLGL